MRHAIAAALALVLAAGCLAPPAPPAPSGAPEFDFDGERWPDLSGVTLTILDHGAFAAFDAAKMAFENATGATVEHVEADDTGSALQRAAAETGRPTFDVIYGVDNVLWARALELDVFEPYTPDLAHRVDPAYVFFDAGRGAWPATPVDHGYIGVNVDARHPALAGASVDDLEDVKAHARLFVTEDPRTSTPGLGFLLATIATYGDAGDGGRARDATSGSVGGGWQAYWTALFEGGVLVTSGWTEAYEQHFSGGYGVDYGGLGDKPIVTSYTESPAYEHSFGRPRENLSKVVLAPKSTFHQIQTMGIAKGTPDLLAAEAWIEFTLTDEFQALAAPNGVYPVVRGVDVSATYGGVDPAPGTFEPADLDVDTVGENLPRWIEEWTELCEAHDCA